MQFRPLNRHQKSPNFSCFFLSIDPSKSQVMKSKNHQVGRSEKTKQKNNKRKRLLLRINVRWNNGKK